MQKIPHKACFFFFVKKALTTEEQAECVLPNGSSTRLFFSGPKDVQTTDARTHALSTSSRHAHRLHSAGVCSPCRYPQASTRYHTTVCWSSSTSVPCACNDDDTDLDSLDRSIRYDTTTARHTDGTFHCSLHAPAGWGVVVCRPGRPGTPS